MLFNKIDIVREIGAVSLTLLIFSPIFKRAEIWAWLPCDVTIVLLIPIILSFPLILFQHPKIKLDILLVLMLFLMPFLFSVLFDDYYHPYILKKALGFLFTILCIMYSLVLFRSWRDVRLFMFSIWIFSFFICSIACSKLFLGSVYSLGRLTIFNGNPIHLGRISGLLFITTFVFFSEKYICFNHILKIVFFSVAFISILGSGSKAPLIGLITSLIVYALSKCKNREIIKNMLFIILLFSILTLAIGNILPLDAHNRMYSFILHGDIGSGSGLERLLIWQTTISKSYDDLLGYGFGSFPTVVDYTPHLYPHNIFLEFFLEEGMIMAFLFFFMCLTSFFLFFKIARKKNEIAAKLGLCYFTYLFIQAQFSGDINGNRLFLIILFLGLMAPHLSPARFHDHAYA